MPYVTFGNLMENLRVYQSTLVSSSFESDLIHMAVKLFSTLDEVIVSAVGEMCQALRKAVRVEFESSDDNAKKVSNVIQKEEKLEEI